jgi:ribosomal protein S18 acetylase RimI-like enzyme
VEVPPPPGLRRATLADRPAIEAIQHAAYARNRDILGVVPIPLQADYGAVLRDWEVFLAADEAGLAGVLIVEPRAADLLIWSIATAPVRQGQGWGKVLLAGAEAHARALGRDVVRLYTGQKLTGNVAWYSRNGYRVEGVETLTDRVVVHMMKPLH